MGIVELNFYNKSIRRPDRWLASRCQAERDEGRKSIVFIRQTGKRDIQSHVAQILQDNGLRVGVLSSSVEPRRRVAWIKKHIGSIDVLITNARLVKVGLNLRMFATAVFYEIEWSLLILWQAMRRVHTLVQIVVDGSDALAVGCFPDGLLLLVNFL